MASHAQADAKAKSFKLPPPVVTRDAGMGFGSSNGLSGLGTGVGGDAGSGAGGGGPGVEDITAMKNLQYVVNVRGLATLEEYCCRYRPIDDGERDREGPAYSELSAAMLAKEQHDKYRSSIPSPTAANGRQVSRAAATTRNLSMAMHLTSAAGSAVKA